MQQQPNACGTCGGPHYAKGLCEKHYKRAYRAAAAKPPKAKRPRHSATAAMERTTAALHCLMRAAAAKTHHTTSGVLNGVLGCLEAAAAPPGIVEAHRDFHRRQNLRKAKGSASQLAEYAWNWCKCGLVTCGWSSPLGEWPPESLAVLHHSHTKERKFLEDLCGGSSPSSCIVCTDLDCRYNRTAVEAALWKLPFRSCFGKFVRYRRRDAGSSPSLDDGTSREVLLGPLDLEGLRQLAKEDPEFRAYITSQEGMRRY